MWPFKKKPVMPRASDLTEQELQWLDAHRRGLTALADTAGLSSPRTDNRLSLADELIRWWHRQPADDRVDPNLIVSAAGIALGDALAKEFRLEWKIITDSFGTDIGLWRERGHIVLSPTHSVAKRFSECPDGFVELLSRELRDGLRGMDNGKADA